MVNNFTVYFFFKILPCKVHADTINDLHYRGGKMATMSEMFVRNGLKVGFERNTNTNKGYQGKLHHKWTENGKFHDFFTNLYNFFLVGIVHYAWLRCSGFQDFFGTEIS